MRFTFSSVQDQRHRADHLCKYWSKHHDFHNRGCWLKLLSDFSFRSFVAHWSYIKRLFVIIHDKKDW